VTSGAALSNRSVLPSNGGGPGDQPGISAFNLPNFNPALGGPVGPQIVTPEISEYREALGWISHELSSPRYLAEQVMPDLLAGIERGGRTRDDLDVVVSACCSIDADPHVARRRAAGLVAFYATVRTYADFFDFHGVADDQQAVIDAFRAGTGADHLAAAASDRMVDALTLTGDRDTVAGRLAAYDGIADSVKLSPPTHGLPAADTRAAQDGIIALIRELNR